MNVYIDIYLPCEMKEISCRENAKKYLDDIANFNEELISLGTFPSEIILMLEQNQEKVVYRVDVL
jgi:hypothetical protein